MSKPLSALNNDAEAFSRIVMDDSQRMQTQFTATYAIVGVVSLVMTIVELITGHKVLMYIILCFGLMCLLNLLLAFGSKKTALVATTLFQIETIALFSYFLISGEPHGFSVCWTALMPTCGLLLFKRRRGTQLCVIMFAELLFFFWTPWGRNLLLYKYDDVFMMRFPLLFAAFYGVSLLFEALRQEAFDNYVNLSTHDTLTGTMNRMGLQKYVDKSLSKEKSDCISFMIFDLDHFKNVNDEYGHFNGDKVLVQTSVLIAGLTGLPVCRWGGEEFAVYDVSGRIDREFAQGICKGFEDAVFDIGDAKLKLTVSIGLVKADPRQTPFLQLGRAADECLYEAKETGRNKAVFKDLRGM